MGGRHGAPFLEPPPPPKGAPWAGPLFYPRWQRQVEPTKHWWGGYKGWVGVEGRSGCEACVRARDCLDFGNWNAEEGVAGPWDRRWSDVDARADKGRARDP